MKDSDRNQNKLRREGRRARTGMTPESRERASAQICDTVIRSGYFRRSSTIACYLASDVEVDTWRIISRAWAMDKQIFAPVVSADGSMQFGELNAESDLVLNQFGLLEPNCSEFADPRHFDIVITPVVAFDSSGNRIGMGSGYFDRCFSFLKERKTWLHPKLVGLAFDCQRVNKIAPNPWDIGLYRIITETT